MHMKSRLRRKPGSRVINQVMATPQEMFSISSLGSEELSSATVITMKVAQPRKDRKVLQSDALTENLRWHTSIPLFLLEEKVKTVKMGRMKKEGWIRKVLSIFECQVETRPVTRPGNSSTAKLRMNPSKML